MKRNRVGFNFALAGLTRALKQEFNIRIHLIVLVIVIMLGLILGLNVIEWGLVAVVSGFVLTLELVNTVVEYITDVLFPDYDQTAKQIKDISAAAVLVSSLTAVAVGLLIFIPKLVEIFV